VLPALFWSYVRGRSGGTFLLIKIFFYIMAVEHTALSFLIGFGRFDCIGWMLLCPSFYTTWGRADMDCLSYPNIYYRTTLKVEKNNINYKKIYLILVFYGWTSIENSFFLVGFIL
jgi:hypothetical protein